MNYNDTLEMAGAKVLAYETFGSYQGDWIAKIEYNGEVKWIKDYYGSCSGCDALEAEFDFSYHDHPDTEYYNPFYNGFKEDCEECQKLKQRVIDFGKNYINDAISYDEVLASVSENIDWDLDADEMVKFVKENK